MYVLASTTNANAMEMYEPVAPPSCLPCACPLRFPPDCISNTASHLPKLVQRTVDVDVHRWRYERGAMADESGSAQGHGAMAVLEGWKVAVEALDQSHRCVVGSKRLGYEW